MIHISVKYVVMYLYFTLYFDRAFVTFPNVIFKYKIKTRPKKPYVPGSNITK